MKNIFSKKRYFNGRVIFDHLPKTAGQAVNAWLLSQLGLGCVTENLIGNHRDLIRQYGGIYPVISGHIQFNGEGLDPLYQYMTCLREPVERAISYIFFVINNHNRLQLGVHYEDVSRFIETDGFYISEDFKGYICNPYVSHFLRVNGSEPISDDAKIKTALDVVEQYAVNGLYEDLPQFMASVARLLGLASPAGLPKVNVTKARPTIDQISPALLQRLQQLNSLDLELYQLLRLRLKQRQEQQTVFFSAVSKCDPYNRVEFLGSDKRLLTQCGRLDGTRLISNHEAGFLIYGPYVRLAPGHYEARLSVSHDSVLAGAWMDVVSDGGKSCWTKLELPQPPVGLAVVVAFELPEVCTDLEVRLWVPAGADVAVNSLCIEPISGDKQRHNNADGADTALPCS